MLHDLFLKELVGVLQFLGLLLFTFGLLVDKHFQSRLSCCIVIIGTVDGQNPANHRSDDDYPIIL